MTTDPGTPDWYFALLHPARAQTLRQKYGPTGYSLAVLDRHDREFERELIAEREAVELWLANPGNRDEEPDTRHYDPDRDDVPGYRGRGQTFHRQPEDDDWSQVLR